MSLRRDKGFIRQRVRSGIHRHDKERKESYGWENGEGYTLDKLYKLYTGTHRYTLLRAQVQKKKT